MDGRLDSDGEKSETEQGAGGEKDQVLVPESSPVTVISGKNVDGVCSNGEEPLVTGTVGEGEEAVEKSAGDLLEKKLVQTNTGDVSMVHLSANRSVPASGLNAVIPSTNQLTIFFNGNVCIYDGIPAEKMHEIMLIAASAAKSADMKMNGIQSPFTSPIPTRPPSPQGTTNNLASPQALCFPAQKSSICGLQEFPIARRQSLQRFLEKRRDRLGSKAPYRTPSTKVADNIENSFSADNAPDLVSFKHAEEEFQPSITAS